MSLTKKCVASLVVACCLVGQVASHASDAAFSHIFQATPDYTIAHKQFHDNAAIVTPFLVSRNEENLTIPPGINVPDANSFLRAHQQPELVAQPLPAISPEATYGGENTKLDLPPGYVGLPAMINPPPGYQIFRKNSPYY